MFKCENKSCNTQVPARQPVNRIITETREKTYENFVYKRGKKSQHVRLDKGYEIVKQIEVCPECYINMTGLKPKLNLQPPQAPVRSKPKFNTNKRDKKTWRNPNQDNKAKPRESITKKVPIVQVINRFDKKSK